MKAKPIQGILLFAILAFFLAYSCHKKPVAATAPPADTTQAFALTPDTIIVPLHFPALVYPADNKPFKELAQLGRMLYYDPILSNDGRACASCHAQNLGFTVPGLYNNTMPVLPHVNLGWYTNFMWDASKTGTLEDVMLFEVKEFFATDLAKINQSPVYMPLFRKYFGVSAVTYKELAYSLAQFVRTLVSGNSKYDRSLRGLYKLTPDEYEGFTIFFSEKGDCFHCHVNPITTDNLLHNIGLDSIYANPADRGYYNVSGNAADLGKFRTPNLRNVALRNRFMHDGRFASLAEVIEFYDHGMHKTGNLDPVMSLPAKVNGLHLTDVEKQQLIAFLHTLTDSTFITNPSYGNPY